MAVFHPDDATRDESIARLLAPRTDGFAVAATDPALITQVAVQSESRVELAARTVYAWPLQNPITPLLQQIVEQLTVCYLIRTTYVGSSPSTEGDDYNEKLCSSAEKLLEGLQEGKLRLPDEKPPDSLEPGTFLATAVVPRADDPIDDIEWADPTPEIGTGFTSRRNVGAGGNFGF